MKPKLSFAAGNRLYQRVYSSIAGTPPQTNLFHFQFIVARSLHKFVKDSLRSFDTSTPTSVLDVGCGSLPYKSFSGPEWIWTGLDVEGNPLADIWVATTDKTWDLPSESFDLVLCTEVLEHSKYPENILTEIHRVLKPGGKLILTTPFIYPIHGAPSDYRRFTPHFYEDNLNGFELKVLRLTGGYGSTLATVILNLIEYQCQKIETYFVIRAILLPFWLLYSLGLNLAAGILDRFDQTNSLGTNVVLLAVKKSL